MTSIGPGEGWFEVTGTSAQRHELVRQLVEANLRAQLEEIGEELHLAPTVVEALVVRMMRLVEPGIDRLIGRVSLH